MCLAIPLHAWHCERESATGAESGQAGNLRIAALAALDRYKLVGIDMKMVSTVSCAQERAWWHLRPPFAPISAHQQAGKKNPSGPPPAPRHQIDGHTALSLLFIKCCMSSSSTAVLPWALEHYIAVHDALTKGQGTVRPVSEIEEAFYKQTDLKHVSVTIENPCKCSCLLSPGVGG